jgi:hypothetical protein
MANEGLELGSLNLNNQVRFTTESMTFTPAAPKPLLVGNAAADGEVLISEPHYSNSTFEIQVRVMPQATTEAALTIVGELLDAVQQCARTEGGSELKWTPAETSTTWTYYALAGEVAELPITVDGELAGWFLKTPVVKIKLTCRPFGYTPERTIHTATESGAEPQQTFYVSGVKGDVQAESRLIVKDTATQERRFVQWGRDLVTSETNPNLVIRAEQLATSGFGGTTTTKTGAWEEKVVKATGVTSATTICSTGRVAHVGSYGVNLRLWVSAETAQVRIAYRSGDGPLSPLEWKTPPVVAGWANLYMGEVFLDEVKLGSQSGEIRIEHIATSGSVITELNYLRLVPTGKASGKARGVASNAATSLIAYDNFEQLGKGGEIPTTEPLEGKAPNFPSTTWAMVNKTGANGLLVRSGSMTGRREVVDTNANLGCFALVSTTSYTTFVSSLAVLSGTRMVDAGGSRIGLLGRYVSTEKWVMGVLARSGNTAYLQVIKNVAGTVTLLANASTGLFVPTEEPGSLVTSTSISFGVAANGTFTASCAAAQVSGRDADLASGGALATGRAGIYDSFVYPTAKVRLFDSFQLLGGEEPAKVIYPSERVEFNSEGAFRQDATGTYYGIPSVYRGGNFFLDPAGSTNRINRIAVAARRNDVEVEEDAPVTDKQSVEVKVRERYIAPR